MWLGSGRTLAGLIAFGIAYSAAALPDPPARVGEPARQLLALLEREKEDGKDDGEVALDDPVVAKLVAEARTDLVERLSIDEDAVEVVSAARVTWRDSSLGCPKPGTMYMQMLQPGVRIELRAEAELFPYHSNLQGPPFYCATPSSTPPLPADEE